VSPAQPGEILIDGEAIVEVLGHVEAAILVREADGPESAIRAGHASNDSPDHFRASWTRLGLFPVLLGDRSEREVDRRELSARRP
jgi:hypothetical protein